MNRYNPNNPKQGMFISKAEQKRRDKVSTRTFTSIMPPMLT